MNQPSTLTSSLYNDIGNDILLLDNTSQMIFPCVNNPKFMQHIHNKVQKKQQIFIRKNETQQNELKATSKKNSINSNEVFHTFKSTIPSFSVFNTLKTSEGSKRCTIGPSMKKSESFRKKYTQNHIEMTPRCKPISLTEYDEVNEIHSTKIIVCNSLNNSPSPNTKAKREAVDFMAINNSKNFKNGLKSFKFNISQAPYKHVMERGNSISLDTKCISAEEDIWCQFISSTIKKKMNNNPGQNVSHV